MFDLLSLLAINQNWLLTTNLVLSSLLLLWVVRYKTLYQTFKGKAQQHSNSLDELNEGFYRSEIDGKIVHANPALIEMMGFTNKKDFLAEINDTLTGWYIDENRRAEFSELLRSKSRLQGFVSKATNPNTGEIIWVSENAHLVFNQNDGRPTHYEGSVQNITDAVQRGKLEDRIEKLSSNLPGGLFQLQRSPEGEFTVPYVSRGFMDIMGLESNFIGNPSSYLKRIHPDHKGRYLQTLTQSIEQMTGWAVEFKIERPGGYDCWMGIIATPEKLDDGSVILHGHINNISERKEAEGKIAYYAYYDPLTRLPNRTFFMHQLKRALASSSRSGEFGAILFLDIDNFKLLNDTHGHATGDLLLQEVSNRLSSTVRGNDIVSRFGGDEFVILLDAIGDSEIEASMNASVVARKIITEFDKGFNLSDIEQNSSPSIGIVTFHGNNGDADTLVKNADIAMYEAKKQGRNNYVVFDSNKSKVVANLDKLQSRLGIAIKNRELTVYYQPQVDHNGHIYGAEALVRWQHPDLGLLMPDDFIPLAEQSGLICQLNDLVLEKSMRDLAGWRENGANNSLHLAINISPQQLRQTSFVSNVQNYSDKLGVPLNMITLEVTEHIMARDFETMTMRMQEIRQLGVKISLDDFGTGYSSLSQLNELPFDEVKIDGSFISNLEECKASRSLVEATIAMAHALKLEIVAEHVNTNFQERFLLVRGCQKFQGFSYSKPLPEIEFKALISTNTAMRIG